MENRLTRKIYNRSPVFLQNVYTSVFGLQKHLRRYGGSYRKYYDFFLQSARWKRSELETFQDEKIRQVICNAYENVPFYRQRMQELGLGPGDFRGVADLPKLPILEKTHVRQADKLMLSTTLPRRKLRSAVTSGSTGFPMTNYWTADVDHREYGFHWARRRPGVRRNDSHGNFTGLQLVPANSLEPPFWRMNWAANQTCYSVFHMAPQTFPLYLRHIKKMRHVYLAGYPSVIAKLGKFVLDAGMDLEYAPKAVFTTAEQLLPEHRAWIENGFKTRAHDQYGQNEKAASITQYDCGHLHYDMDYSVIEFLPKGETDDGRAICEIICTAFDNPAAPLIRYRIGDLAVLGDPNVQCSANAGPVVECIYGRTAQTLISRDGRRISNISVIAKRCRHVDAMQCIQEEPGVLEIRIVKGAGFTAGDEKTILFQFGQKMGQMDFVIKYVDDVERTGTGKFLSIISRVPPEKLAAMTPRR